MHCFVLIHPAWATGALDDDEFFNMVRIDPRVTQRHPPSEGMCNNMQRRKILLMNQLGKIVYIFTVAVCTAQHPCRITMTTEVRGNDMVIRTQFLGYPVPIVTVVTIAMN